MVRASWTLFIVEFECFQRRKYKKEKSIGKRQALSEVIALQNLSNTQAPTEESPVTSVVYLSLLLN